MDQSTILEESANRYPLSSRQKDPGGTERSAKHVIPLALRIKGELDIDALKGALNDVVERHESLRTRINYSETDGNTGFQEVLPPLPVPFTIHDITTIPSKSRDEVAVDLFQRLHEELLPFSATPSLRASLHRFDDHDAVLTFLTHHLFSDNWSAGLLRREFAACYRARVSGVPHTLPTPVQYREYSSWEQEFLRSEKAANARRFWEAKLAGARMYTLPADRPHGPDNWASRSEIRGFSIGADDYARVVARATQNRCTVWHLFLAAIMVLAEKVSGLSDITLLTVDNGRTVKTFHNTIGFLANLVPLRLQFGDCESFLDLILLARKASMEAHRNQISFKTVLELAPNLMETFADPRALPPGFNYLRPTVNPADLQFADGVELVVLPEDVPSMYHRGACMWSFIRLPSGAFRCVIEYEPEMVDANTIDHWGSDFISLILAIADRPDQAWKNR